VKFSKEHKNCVFYSWCFVARVVQIST